MVLLFYASSAKVVVGPRIAVSKCKDSNKRNKNPGVKTLLVCLVLLSGLGLGYWAGCSHGHDGSKPSQ